MDLHAAGRGLSGHPPEEVDWEFSIEEYRRRLVAARDRMASLGVDCLFLTSEKNIRYLTGFHTQIWVSPTRPRYVLVPLDSEPIAIVPTTNVPGFRATTWLQDIRHWPAPRPDDDGVSLAIQALASCAKPRGRIGAEIGPEMRVEMPIQDFLRIREALGGRSLVDAGPVLKPLRMVKSPPEVEHLRLVGQAASRAFDKVRSTLAEGQTERDVFRMLHRLLIEEGVDRVPYLVPVAGPEGVTQINMGPTDRRLEPGDLLFIDCGATRRGYFCDFDRNFAIRSATDEIRNAYARVFEATQAGLEAVRPGRTCSEVWQAMTRVLTPTGATDTPIGRMGHGLGLDITEPPSISSGDRTILRPGMVLTLEPSLVLPGARGGSQRLMVHEENLVVTEDGCELLTRRAPAALPVV